MHRSVPIFLVACIFTELVHSEISAKLQATKVSPYQFIFLNLADNANLAGFNHLNNDTRDSVGENFEYPPGDNAVSSTESSSGQPAEIQASSSEPSTSIATTETTTENPTVTETSASTTTEFPTAEPTLDGDVNGSECFRKVVMVRQPIFDEGKQCTHTYQRRCFESLRTIFKQTEVEECREVFKKECRIEYERVPQTRKITVCKKGWKRDCDREGEMVCSFLYQSVCQRVKAAASTKTARPVCEDDQEVTCDDLGENCIASRSNRCEVTEVDLPTEVKCRKEKVKVCGPETCPLVRDLRKCGHELETTSQEVPRETCKILPAKTCSMASKIVPKIVREEQCLEVPKEVCSVVKINHRMELRPVIKRVCPTQ